MERDHIPGVAACIIKDERIAWSNSYGWADIDRRIAMSLDRLQNIASISKTFTTTALLQIWEEARFALDDDVSEYLSFPVRNPNHPSAKITFRHLLTHRSSIRDGSNYAYAYACGDPGVSLAEWIEGYLNPGGVYYDASENFHRWAPEGGWEYCNVSYGLIALLVEVISRVPFGEYCRNRIFEPLGIDQTSWYLADIDTSQHSVPYTYVSGGDARGPSWGGIPLGVISSEGPGAPTIESGYEANCLYNHPNFPDGFLRTSVRQLSRAARAYLNGGMLDGKRILQEGTVRGAFSTNVMEGQRIQGLTWYAYNRVRGQIAWGHGGSDPGVNTDIRLLLGEKVAAIAFMNTNRVNPAEITQRMLEAAPGL
jgi:CubicO group peptidase (beta-lactamase class C family)